MNALRAIMLSATLAIAGGAATTAEAQEPVRASTKDQYKPGQTNSGGFNLLNTLRDALKIPKVEMTDAERAACNRMIAIMPELAGGDGRFNLGDIPAIRTSVSPQLSAIVDAEILRRKDQQVYGKNIRLFPRVRYGIRNAVANGHLNRNWGHYHAMGMSQAYAQLDSGLASGLAGAGVTANTPDPRPTRNLTLEQLRQYGEDAKLMAQYKKRCEEAGLPTIEFPNGMGREDLIAIRDGRLPPNGRIVPRNR